VVWRLPRTARRCTRATTLVVACAIVVTSCRQREPPVAIEDPAVDAAPVAPSTQGAPPVAPDASRWMIGPPRCETKRVDDLCAFLAEVTRGLESEDPMALACVHPEGKPLVEWTGAKECVASSTGVRRPFLCGLPWPGEKLHEQVRADAARLRACLPGWEDRSQGSDSAELVSERLRCELFSDLTLKTYSLACSRRNLVARDR
jgi:hypothetical protein